MHEELFDYMKRQGIKLGKIEKEINSWSYERCLNFTDKCNDILESEKIPKGSTFSFVASSSLSGDIIPCTLPDCRLERIDSLARFSALYSDKVLILNPFNKYHFNTKSKPRSYKLWLIGDMKVLLKIQPLIESDLMWIGSGILHLCSKCYGKLIQQEKKVREKAKQVEDLLVKEYLDKIKVECEMEKSTPFVYVSGPEEIIDHSKHILVPEQNNPFFDVFMKYASKNAEIMNIKIKHFLLSTAFIEPTIQYLMIQDTYSRVFKYNSITDRNVDMFIREKLEVQPENIRASNVMRNLNHLVPHVGNVSIKDLIKIRKKEEDSLKVYRDSLNKVLDKVKKGADEEEVKSIFESEIQPELNKLDMLFKKNKKLATQSFMKKALISSGFISIGLFSGLFPASAILSILGGYKFIETVSEDFSKIFEVPKEIKTSKYYFLWKVKNITPTHKKKL